MLREEVGRRTARLAEIMLEDQQREEDSSDDESSEDEMPGLGGGKAGRGQNSGRGETKHDLRTEASVALLAYYAQKGLSEEAMEARLRQALHVD